MQTIWKEYDQKLDRLEKLNRKLVIETLSQKPQKRINRYMSQNLLGMLGTPVILLFVLSKYIDLNQLNNYVLTGIGLVLIAIVYLSYIYFKGYQALRMINLQSDPVMESVRKINDFKAILWGKMSYNYIVSFVLLGGILLIIWKEIRMDPFTLSFIVAYFVAMIFWIRKKTKMHLGNIENLKKDILELEEYRD